MRPAIPTIAEMDTAGVGNYHGNGLEFAAEHLPADAWPPVRRRIKR